MSFNLLLQLSPLMCLAICFATQLLQFLMICYTYCKNTAYKDIIELPLHAKLVEHLISLPLILYLLVLQV
jgi:hypothetical protein